MFMKEPVSICDYESGRVAPFVLSDGCCICAAVRAVVRGARDHETYSGTNVADLYWDTFELASNKLSHKYILER